MTGREPLANWRHQGVNQLSVRETLPSVGGPLPPVVEQQPGDVEIWPAAHTIMMNVHDGVRIKVGIMATYNATYREGGLQVYQQYHSFISSNRVSWVNIPTVFVLIYESCDAADATAAFDDDGKRMKIDPKEKKR